MKTLYKYVTGYCILYSDFNFRPDSHDGCHQHRNSLHVLQQSERRSVPRLHMMYLLVILYRPARHLWAAAEDRKTTETKKAQAMM